MVKCSRWLTVSVLFVAFCAGAGAQQAESAILFICDGMAQAQVTAARIFKGNARDGQLHLDTIDNVAFVRTYCANTMVTDSAASATAYSTGQKTNAGMIGVDSDGEALETILEAAKAAGKSVGLVSTARITHATPASFVAHVRSRNDESTIAAQLVDYGEVDVVLGGGREYFIPREDGGGQRDERDLLAEAEEKGYEVLETREDFDRILWRGQAGVAPQKILGLFSGSHMSYEVDRPKDGSGEPSLAEMTELAIALLRRNPNGYFLMVEGGRVDHANHQNEGLRATTDFVAFDDAIAVGLDWVKRDPGLVFVATADHETGGMAINGYPDIEIGGVELFASPSQRGRSDIITYASGPGAKREDYEEMSNTDPNYAQPALRFAGSAMHTGVDVPAWAAGVGSERVRGTMENTEIHAVLSELLGLK